MLSVVQKTFTGFPSNPQDCAACPVRKEAQFSFKRCTVRAARSVPKISEHREAKLATAKQKNVYIKVSLGELFGGKEEERRGVQQYKYLQKDSALWKFLQEGFVEAGN